MTSIWLRLIIAGRSPPGIAGIPDSTPARSAPLEAWVSTWNGSRVSSHSETPWRANKL